MQDPSHDPAHPIWSDAQAGIVATISRFIAERKAHAARTVVLVPYGQLIQVARARWAAVAGAGFAPRFETTRNWARSTGGFVASDDDLAFDMARDLLTAQSLLARAGFPASRLGMAGRLVDIAKQLAPLAAAEPPDLRLAWAERMRAVVDAGKGSEWFGLESALNGVALAWASTSAYATDVLWQDAVLSQVDQLVVLDGLQADPLTDKLALRFGDRCLRIPLAASAPPLGQMAVHVAVGPEDEAQRAAACVIEQLANGRAPVALIATDRALTRRISAQLVVQGIAPQDETGWRLSTTRAAADLMSAMRACAHDASSDQVLDWLKCKRDPAAPQAFRARDLLALEARLRDRGMRDWRSWCLHIAASDKPKDVALLDLTNAIEALRSQLARARSFGEWLSATRTLLENTGQLAPLMSDAAGIEVISALYLDADPGEIIGTRCTLAEFTAWVRDVLEAASLILVQERVESPQVVVLPMQQLLGRAFGAVVVPGCDDQRLPASPEPAGDWTPAQREALGLPSRDALEAAQRAAWQVTIGSAHGDLLRREFDGGGEPVRPSPLVQLLDLRFSPAQHQAAKDPRRVVPIALQPVRRPQPHGDRLAIAKLSPTAYEDLRRCPYRFFALRQLGLRSSDELDAEVDKRDFGNWLHAVLGYFHEALLADPTTETGCRLALIETARDAATREFGLSESEFLPFAAAWPAVRDGYLKWLADHEATEGARFVESEPSKELSLGRILLAGRLDRVDATPDGSAFVIDYKTESLDKTRERIKDPTEDTQLAFYAALFPDDGLRAAYVNVGEKASSSVEQRDVIEARDALVQGVMDDMHRISEGQPLPALGEGTVCDYCDARGLCRKDWWSDDQGHVIGAIEPAAVPAIDTQPLVVSRHASTPLPDRPAYEHNGAHVARERFYAIACDPRRSVAVEACAGAGKTWMLVSRIVRALLEEGDAACAPHEILAITFTKKAAGEMRERLDQWLARFAGLPVVELVPELVMRGMDRAAAENASPRLGGLYRDMLSRGRSVQFRTFHAWFASLLRSAPLAVLERLGLPANYQLLEDDSEARVRVWRPFFARVAQEPEALVDFNALVAAHGRSQSLKALDEALTRRVEFTLADTGGIEGGVEHSVATMAEVDPMFADVETPEAVLFDQPDHRHRLLEAARVLGQASQPSFSQKGVELESAITGRCASAVVEALQTQKAEPRKFSDKIAGIEQVRHAQELVARYCKVAAQHAAWMHQQRMTRLTRLLIRCFAEVKAAHGWVDMNDVEQAAHFLLGRSELWGWVQERLDARVKHLLIDEFQDTNPLQWQALFGWLGSYAGAGNRPPGLFIVGDPKQSIYRFRRAEPQVFMAARRFVREELGGDLLNCDHTHRNARQVVALVNDTLLDAQRAGEYSDFRAHSTESAATGAAWALPPISRDAVTTRAAGRRVHAEGEMHWRDSLVTPRVLPEEKLLQKECEQVARWIAQRIADGLPPSKIMVLARRRSRLSALQDELRKRHIAVQQPEKDELNDAPEVQDIVALIDVLVSPDHDLSLARALKSPLWNIDDDTLVGLALQRRDTHRSWFELLRLDEGIGPLAGIGAQLVKWQQWLSALPPHDALNAIFHDADVFAKFGAAAPAPLRAGVLANLRGLIAASLDIDGARFATPYALVRALRAGGVRAPTTTAVDAVQLLTVHGAKGLEAEVVLLLDTDAAPTRSQTMGVLVKWPGESKAPERFVFIASEKNPPACATDDLAEEQAARSREEINGLYVAATRARTELIVSSVEPLRANPQSWWSRLQVRCDLLAAPPGEAASVLASSAASFDLLCLPVPDARPIGAVRDGVGDSVGDGRSRADSRASSFGQAMHRLLEWAQPGAALSASHIRAAGREFGLEAATARAAAAMAQRIREGAGTWVWDADAIDWHGNEVTLIHEGQTLRIDRLVRHRATGAWWVFDYKSAGRPERDDELIVQLHRYRDAVQNAYPGDTVHAAFLTGQGELVTLDA